MVPSRACIPTARSLVYLAQKVAANSILFASTSSLTTNRPMFLHQRTLSTNSPPTTPCTILSGIQPTGVPHLGNYLGALANWVRLQRESPAGTTIYYSIVDLHAITVPQDPTELRQAKLDMAISLLACGIDPKRSVLFEQSRVPQHAELAWVLSCATPVGWLSRMTQWKVGDGALLFTL